jgi:hypothetical protein
MYEHFVSAVLRKWFVATSKLKIESRFVSKTEGTVVSMYRM